MRPGGRHPASGRRPRSRPGSLALTDGGMVQPTSRFAAKRLRRGASGTEGGRAAPRLARLDSRTSFRRPPRLGGLEAPLPSRPSPSRPRRSRPRRCRRCRPPRRGAGSRADAPIGAHRSGGDRRSPSADAAAPADRHRRSAATRSRKWVIQIAATPARRGLRPPPARTVARLAGRCRVPPTLHRGGPDRTARPSSAPGSRLRGPTDQARGDACRQLESKGFDCLRGSAADTPSIPPARPAVSSLGLFGRRAAVRLPASGRGRSPTVFAQQAHQRVEYQRCLLSRISFWPRSPGPRGKVASPPGRAWIFIIRPRCGRAGFLRRGSPPAQAPGSGRPPLPTSRQASPPPLAPRVAISLRVLYAIRGKPAVEITPVAAAPPRGSDAAASGVEVPQRRLVGDRRPCARRNAPGQHRAPDMSPPCRARAIHLDHRGADLRGLALRLGTTTATAAEPQDGRATHGQAPAERHAPKPLVRIAMSTRPRMTSKDRHRDQARRRARPLLNRRFARSLQVLCALARAAASATSPRRRRRARTSG